MIGKELGLGKWALLIGRATAEINLYSRIYLEDKGIRAETSAEREELNAKLDKRLAQLDSLADAASI